MGLRAVLFGFAFLAAQSAAFAQTTQRGVASPRPLPRQLLLVLPNDTASDRQVARAIKMALEDVNRNVSEAHQLVLGGEMIRHNGDRFDFAELADALVEMQDDSVVAAMGLSSAFMVELLGAVTGAMNVPVITTTMSPRKAWNRAYYPSLLYASPTDSLLPSALKDLALQFFWRKICLIYSKEFSALSAVEEFFAMVAPAFDIQMALRIRFEEGSDAMSVLQGVLTDTNEQCFAFVVGVNARSLLPVMRAAHTIGLVRQGTAWIFLNMVTGPMLLPKGLRRLMDGSLIIRPKLPDFDSRKSLSAIAEKLIDTELPECQLDKRQCLAMEAIHAYQAATQFGRAFQKWSMSTKVLDRHNKRLQLWNVSFPVQRNTASLVQSLASTKLTKGTDPTGYEILNLQGDRLVSIAEWTENGRLNSSNLQEIVWTGATRTVPGWSYQDGKARHLKVLVPLSAPFTYLKEDPQSGEKHLAGVAIDLMKNIAQQLNINYSMSVWRNGSWNNMVELVGNENSTYDMAVGSVTVTANRSRHCDFSRSFYLSGLRMLVPRPKSKSRWWDFLKPFRWTVWLVLAMTLIFSAVVVQLLDSDGIRTERSGHWFFDAIFFTFNVFLFVHEADLISKPMARVFLTLLQFSMHILQSTYTANMASFLSSRTTESGVKSYFDLYRSPVAVRRATSNWAFAQDRLGINNLVNVATAEEAKEALRTGRATAYIADTPHVDKIAASNCDLMLVAQQVDPQRYAFPMRKNSPIKEAVNKAISVAQSSGVVSKSYTKHVHYECMSMETVDSSKKPLTLRNLGGLFVAIALTSLWLTGLKIYWSRKKKKKRPRFPLRSIATHEVCFPAPMNNGTLQLKYQSRSHAGSRETILTMA